ncbi:hypothetical protein [Streptomyces collinus]
MTTTVVLLKVRHERTPLAQVPDRDFACCGRQAIYGVFSINSKRHRGKSVWYGDAAITVNGAVQRHISIGQSEARRVSRALSRRCGIDVPVRPVISVVHAAKLTVKNANPPVLVLAVEDLGRVLSVLSPVLQPDQVAHIYGAARDARTWAA